MTKRIITIAIVLIGCWLTGPVAILAQESGALHTDNEDRSNLQSRLIDSLAFITIHLLEDWRPLYRYYSLDADYVRNIIGIRIWFQKIDRPKVLERYSVFETPIGAVIFKKDDEGRLVPFPIIYDFSSDLGPEEYFDPGDVYRIAIPAGEYYIGFHFATVPGGAMMLQGVRFEGDNRLRPGTYDISPALYGQQ